MSAPGPPTDIKTAMKSTSAIISWKRPTATGSGITGYRVIATSPNGGVSQTVNVGATTVQTEVNNLTRSKKYSFTVTALGSTNSVPSLPTDTKISDALTSSSTEKSFSSDTTAEASAINIIQFQDQRTLASNTYTKFKSHDEYIRYLKGKTILGYN